MQQIFRLIYPTFEQKIKYKSFSAWWLYRNRNTPWVLPCPCSRPPGQTGEFEFFLNYSLCNPRQTKFSCLRLICIMAILSTLMRIRSQCFANRRNSFCSEVSAWSEHLICKDRNSFLSTLPEPITVTKVTISRAQDTGFCVKQLNIKRLSEDILSQEVLWLRSRLAPQSSGTPALRTWSDRFRLPCTGKTQTTKDVDWWEASGRGSICLETGFRAADTLAKSKSGN